MGTQALAQIVVYLIAGIKSTSYEEWNNFLMSKEEIDYHLNLDGLAVFDVSNRGDIIVGGKKYNYSNIMAEYRNGEETQTPLSYFKDIYIDHYYNSKLPGPFNTQGKPSPYSSVSAFRGIQRLAETSNTLQKIDGKTPRLNYSRDGIPQMDEDWLLAIEEGSADIRNKSGTSSNINYSNWNKSKKNYDERAQPVIHIVENPNSKSCFITISIESLVDTIEDEGVGGGDYKGSRIPAPVNLRVETGLVDRTGKQIPFVEKFFQIIALVESPNYMDIGNPDIKDSITDYKDIREIYRTTDNSNQGGISTPFLLPDIPYADIQEDTEYREDNDIKRYVKITKLSTESNSSLINKDLSLIKVTEIIEAQCTYPFSSIVATKIDSRVFNDIPKRKYRAKFKKVKIPSNYYPIYQNGKDKRVFKTVEEFENVSANSKHIYKGDWDGSFKFGWTDNPAWILYDILISTRYGLGEQILEEQVNKWDLYSIGRFCDSVDDQGFFVGVPDERGGLEPRFTCNISFTAGAKIFDVVNSIASIFRGIVYLQNETITFSDDRIKKPMALFTNSNVSDGLFSYQSYAKDQKFNAVEVVYQDKYDGYKTKIEYVENESDIIKRGLFKREFTAAGVTSKAMAKRAAKHLMYQTTKENESVSFIAGTEILLCRPGDLVVIEDELKTLRTNVGRILSIDPKEGVIRTSEPFKTTDYAGSITVYVPTGNKTKGEYDIESQKLRSRVSEFVFSPSTEYPEIRDKFAGLYRYDSYGPGYDIDYIEDSGNAEFELYEEYAIYTGTNNQIIWFDIKSTGWVFSTGKSYTDSDLYNLFIGPTGEKSFNFKSLSKGTAFTTSGYYYDELSTTKRGIEYFDLSGTFLNFDQITDLDYYGGVVDQDINIIGNPQIKDFKITGWGGYKGQQSESYGDKIYVDKNDVSYNLLRYIPEGSTYRFQAKDSSDQVYKITNIKESENNSYQVVAAKYISGKFKEIEDSINFLEKEGTYGAYKTEQEILINDTKYIKIDNPDVDIFVSGFQEGGEQLYRVIAEWEPVENATGYYYYINKPGGKSTSPQTIDSLEINFSPETIGIYTLKIQSLADVFNNVDINTKYFDSDGASFSVQVDEVYEEVENEGVTVVGFENT